jgi:riboflavin synthase
MFTGIIERQGQVIELSRRDASGITQLVIDPGLDFATKLGDSIAVNGACLTVAAMNHGLRFDVSSETLAKTSLGILAVGRSVNLERAMKLGDRLDGHIVAGHVDGVGVVSHVNPKSDGWDVGVDLPRELGRYVIPKGSITVDGVSLTVNSLKDDTSTTRVGLMLIPVTVEVTTFHALTPGQTVNIEVDLIGKYVERLTAFR